MPLAPVLRSLSRARGLAIAAIAMLALGIGALTTTFGLVDASLLRQPPFPAADRLAMLYITRANSQAVIWRERWSYPRIQLLKRLITTFEAIANQSPSGSLTLTGTADAETVSGEFVSPSYFTVLGTRPVRGRLFLPDEDAAAGAHPVILLGYDLWQRRFAGDSAVVGRRIGVNGQQLTVVGVLPRGFGGLSGRAQLWMPTTMAPRLTYADYLTTNQNFISVVGRLRPGTEIAAVRAELAVLGVRINRELPSIGEVPSKSLSATALTINEARVDGTTRRSILTLLAAVALLYLLACANATNLLLGRATERRREAAVRSALGCGHGRLFRFFLAEGVLLSLAGGALGLLLTMWASSIISVPADLWGPRNFYGSLASFDEPAFDLRVGLFGAGLTIVTALLVSWAPAAGMLGSDLFSNLRAGVRGIAAGSGTLRRPSVRGALVAVEAALAVVLLVAGGLMITSFSRMRRTDLGVNAEHVLTFMLRPSEVRVPPAAAPAFLARMLDAITRVHGVVSVTVDGGAPVAGSARGLLHIVGQPVLANAQTPVVLRHYVAPDHFRTLGVPLVVGRTFTEADIAGRPNVAIISKSAATHFWPAGYAIGQRVWFGTGSGFNSPDSSAEIVGIVGDVVSEPLDVGHNRDDFYTPYAQFTYATRMFLVRTAGDPAAMVAPIRKAVASVEPDLPLTEVQTLTDRIGISWSRHRFDAWLFGGFALVAILLASAGIHAVVAYAVAQRTREMGIRMALGAQPAAIVRLVVREGMEFPLLGLLAGIIAAAATTRVLQASLYEITPTDPVVFAATVALLIAVSALACLAPARQATKTDPIDALRAE